MEYIIYCDESEKRGPKYSNFYGGALVRSTDLHEVVTTLEQYKIDHSIKSEMKWTRVSEQFINEYLELTDIFLNFIRDDKVKMRVMFSQNEFTDPRIRNLTKDQRDDSFFMLYYQFFKHAFGLRYSNTTGENVHLKIFFDQIPDKKEKADRFKDYIYRLQHQRAFLDASLFIRREDIIEMDSKQHVIGQCMDIVMGAMFFRLNELHLVKEEGKRFRGKRTRAKEKLYNHINKRIREFYPHFNIGVSTGRHEEDSFWKHQYRHWVFLPNLT